MYVKYQMFFEIAGVHVLKETEISINREKNRDFWYLNNMKNNVRNTLKNKVVLLETTIPT